MEKPLTPKDIYGSELAVVGTTVIGIVPFQPRFSYKKKRHGPSLFVNLEANSWFPLIF